MPRPLYRRVLRGLRPALLGPLRFAVDGGYWRSALLCQSVDRGGRPLPWLTYPAITFLESLDWSGKRILEWGSGHSTLWWAERAGEVFAIEGSRDWYEQVRQRLSAHPRIELHLAEERRQYVELPRGRRFDFAIIDGEARSACAEVALEAVEPEGGILLDNSDMPWPEPGQTGFPILDLMRRHGWQRVDFQGFAPGVARPNCTSLFFRPETRLFERQGIPRIAPGFIPG